MRSWTARNELALPACQAGFHELDSCGPLPGKVTKGLVVG